MIASPPVVPVGTSRIFRWWLAASALLVGLALTILPAAAAHACRVCAGPTGGQYCRFVWENGWTYCYSDRIFCTAGGGQCAIARESLDSDLSGVGSLGRAVAALSPEKQSVPAPAQPATLEGVRAQVHSYAAAGRLPGGQIQDFILLFGQEERDPAWAAEKEREIEAAISSLPLQEYGISNLSVTCATTVCEVVLTQTTTGRESSDWQSLASQFIGSEQWGAAPAETAILVTGAGADTSDTAFFTLLQYERDE